MTMNNRRHTYRHPFVAAEQVKVELVAPAKGRALRCELIDLSIEGMKVRLDANASPGVDEQLTARLLGRPTPPVHLGLLLLGQVKYVLPEGRHVCCGIQFLPAASLPLNEQRESALGRFLVEEQRRALRQRLPAGEE
jgi:hypothetical protein